MKLRHVSLRWLLAVVLLVGNGLGAQAAEKPAVASGKPPATKGKAFQNTLPANIASKVDQAIEKEMKDQEAVGVALGIVSQGKIVYLKGYGLADREKNVAVTPQTVFNWASNSKPVGGVLAMQLVERKMLDLDADVRKYVPEFPDKGVVITTRHLLSHTSGIPHYSNGIVIPAAVRIRDFKAFDDPVAGLNRFKNSPLLFKPGEKDSYSSYGYVLLSAVIQSAGREPFLQQLNNRIARPLGLKSLQVDYPSANQPYWAVGYEKKRDVIVPAREQAHFWKHAAGGFKSNIEDFAKWAQALVNHKLVKPETERQMWEPQKLTDGTKTTRAMGFIVTGSEDSPVVSHNGGQDETRTRMVLWPKTGDAVVLMCNSSFIKIDDFEKAVTKTLKSSDSRAN